MMPMIDGFTLDLEMKDEKDTEGIPVVIITGRWDTKKLFDRTRSAKYIEWLDKPFDIGTLVDVVDRHFETKKG